MQDLTIALVQSDLYWEQIDANLAMFEEKLWALQDQVDLIVLPEMFSTGFSMNAEKLAEPPGGKTFKWMRQMAKVKGAAVTGSCIVKEGGNFYNRLWFVFPDGSSEHYDKKHLFTLAGEGEVFTAGEEQKIVTFKGWRIKPLICYDLRFPVWARSARTEEQTYQYDLLLYVANWPDARIDAWDALLKARAIENISYCAGVNRTGTDDYPKDYPGHSALYAYNGSPITYSEEVSEILVSTLSVGDLSTFREKFSFQEDSDSFFLD